MQQHKYSFVIPVYNRPDEVDELLDSVTKLEFPNGEKIPFEVIIVEDGSTMPCKNVVNKYEGIFEIQYFALEINSGSCAAPRNFGAEKATGDYLLFTDSDCLLSNLYLFEVNNAVINEQLDAFGGPDMAHISFSNLQKAISYSMTSFSTTGGIRNRKSPSRKYYPRGFNYGVKKDIFLELGGFLLIFPGEDIILSVDIVKRNYNVGFIEKAVVFHKRRTSFRKYFKQIYNFGEGRVNLNILLPGTAKLVFCLPSLFTLVSLFLIVSSLICAYAIIPLLLYALIVFVDSSVRNKSITIGFMSIVTSFIQHWGYGTGFIIGTIRRKILRKGMSKRFIKG